MSVCYGISKYVFMGSLLICWLCSWKHVKKMLLVHKRIQCIWITRTMDVVLCCDTHSLIFFLLENDKKWINITQGKFMHKPHNLEECVWLCIAPGYLIVLIFLCRLIPLCYTHTQNNNNNFKIKSSFKLRV